ncbi:hypothetical protein BGZ80_010600 [Entomortierella chlamydospora]|uniref:Uncharacterized protein n=1 Tax=Entomortierella chlamydospora TaxID=101097 RepID=A0A9P6SZW4_9FUNG|nr:hypothetical protein BGZ79_007740 [Entomortierella chlamydospora]KAG0014182.1 hypothetical protein BGZ80_010600 [Entomortierella chlamydospora]
MKFSVTLAVIALSTAIAFTQAAPTKTEPLAAVNEIEAQAVAAAASPSPTRVCTGGPIHDKRGYDKRGYECPIEDQKY